MLQYRNCPDQDTKHSPAIIVFGRAIRDFIPIMPGKYQPHNTWMEVRDNREIALSKRHMKISERLSEHTKALQELKVGDSVRIQNQVGPNPLKWDKTGTVVEIRQHDQYVIKVDGSGRVTVRNRKFLRKFSPFSPPMPSKSLLDQMPPILANKSEIRGSVLDTDKDESNRPKNVTLPLIPTDLQRPTCPAQPESTPDTT